MVICMPWIGIDMSIVAASTACKKILQTISMFIIIVIFMAALVDLLCFSSQPWCLFQVMKPWQIHNTEYCHYVVEKYGYLLRRGGAAKLLFIGQRHIKVICISSVSNLKYKNVFSVPFHVSRSLQMWQTWPWSWCCMATKQVHQKSLNEQN